MEDHASETISPIFLEICKWATLGPNRSHLVCAPLISQTVTL